jgi:hypothetical protein
MKRPQQKAKKGYLCSSPAQSRRLFLFRKPDTPPLLRRAEIDRQIRVLMRGGNTSMGNISSLGHGDSPAAYVVEGGTDSQLLLLYQVG